MIELVDVYGEPLAMDILYDLLKERSTEDDPNVNISHRALPPYEEHRAFVDSFPYRAWHLIRLNEEVPCEGEAPAVIAPTYVGYVSITRRDEIGIVLFRAHRGKGYGRKAMQLLLDRYKPQEAIASERAGVFLANINPKNERSIRLFTSLGFKLRQHTYGLE